MFLVRNGFAVALLLISTQSFGFADHEVDNLEGLTEVVATYLRLPWLEGLDWIANSTESSDGKKVKALIQGIESGEPWALQIFKTLLKDQPHFRRKKTQNFRTCDQYTGAKGAHENVDIRDEHCMVPADTVSKYATTDIGGECGDLTSLVCDGSHKAQNYKVVTDSAKNTPLVSEDFTAAEISAIALFSMIGAVVVGCTICDCVARSRSAKSSATVNSLAGRLSLYTNAIALLKTEASPDAMPAIYGIRCVCFVTVIFIHRLQILACGMKDDITLLDMLREKDAWTAIFIQMTPYAVDTFCVISGFLAAYLFLRIKNLGKGGKVLIMYVYRYLRLTPCIAALLLFVVVLFPRIASGSMWESSGLAVVHPCRENWLLNLLYVQNLIDAERMCLLHTWYLAVDMQLFWISPLILFPLYHWPKFGRRVLGLFLVASIITPAIVLAVKEYGNALLRYDRDTLWHLRNGFLYYMATYNRACPHMIGILLGYDVATRKRRLSQVNVTINWIVAGLIVIFCGWSVNGIYNSTFAYDLKKEMAWAILVRPSWAIASAWFIYACTQGYGGVITRFLSLPFFLPLSRLSYCIYLVHPVIEVPHIMSSPLPPAFFSVDNFIGLSVDVVLSIVVAFVLNLFIETPAIALTKMMLANYGSQSEPATPIEKPRKKIAVDSDTL